MGVRWMMVLLLWVSCVPCQGYQARLWFRNLATGAENPGALLAIPGDQIAIRFKFDGRDGWRKWSTLQVTLVLDHVSIVSDADANTWRPQFHELANQSNFIYMILWQPSSGPMHDRALEPGNATYPWVADKGLYALIAPLSPDNVYFDKELYRFTVQAGSEGQVLDWALDGRDTGSGLSTRILDDRSRSVDVTDNRVVVVPEPGWLTLPVPLLAALVRWRGRRPGRQRAPRVAGVS